MSEPKIGFYFVAAMYMAIGVVLAFPVYLFAVSAILPGRFSLIVCVVAFGLFGLFSAFHQDEELDNTWLGVIGRRGRVVLGCAVCVYFLWSLAKSVL